MGVRGERGSGSLGGGQELFALITVAGLGGNSLCMSALVGFVCGSELAREGDCAFNILIA
jgi:hypothetical protein